MWISGQACVWFYFRSDYGALAIQVFFFFFRMAATTKIYITNHYAHITHKNSNWIFTHGLYKQFNYKKSKHHLLNRIRCFDIFYQFLKGSALQFSQSRCHEYSEMWESICFWLILPNLAYVQKITNETILFMCMWLSGWQNVGSGL